MNTGARVVIIPATALYLEATASGRGPVWGTDVSTADTAIAAAAMDAGVLETGETRLIRVTILAGQEKYEGTVRNGVTSHDFGPFPKSFRVEPLPEAASAARPGSLAVPFSGRRDEDDAPSEFHRTNLHG